MVILAAEASVDEAISEPMTQLQAMSTRILLEVSIRFLGLWSVFTAINGLVVAPFYMPSIWGSAQPGPLIAACIFSTVAASVQGLLGAMLIGWAPRIAARFYPAGPEEIELHLKIGPGDLYHVACFVLGAYLLVQAAEPACRLAIAGMRGMSWDRGSLIAWAITAMVDAAAGIVLLFGSRRIGQLFSNLRYDPDTIPKQQVSLAFLLLLVLVVTLILGVIRAFTFGGL
jgi:hypothetical protein